MWYIDNSTLYGQINEAIIQTIFWSIVLTIVRRYVMQYIQDKEYFQYVLAQQGDARGDELVTFMTALPQHTTGAVLLWFGVSFKRNDIFRSAILSEFAYETYDLLNTWIQYLFFARTDQMTEKEIAHKILGLKVITWHHIPGMLVIIPAVYMFGDNHRFQRTVCSLLIYTPLWLFCLIKYKTRNINHPEGRKQFLFYNILSTAIFAWGRFYWSPMEMYGFLKEVFWAQTISVKFGLLFYGILIYSFNLLLIVVAIEHLHNYFSAGKAGSDEKQKAQQRLRRSSSITILTDFVSKTLDIHNDS